MGEEVGAFMVISYSRSYLYPTVLNAYNLQGDGYQKAEQRQECYCYGYVTLCLCALSSKPARPEI